MLFFDALDRMLLVEPVYKDYWEFPGGCVEAGESPYSAAVRELKEEVGLSVIPGRLLVMDYVPPRVGRTEGVMVIFDGGLLHSAQAAQIQLPPNELRGWSWCTEEEAALCMSEPLARRAMAAKRARQEGITLYLENGIIVA